MNPQRLNLGCGTDIRPGWVNLDVAPLPGVDVVHDLKVLPLPFEDGRFDHVACLDVLEHLDYVPVLKEIHRILKPGGTVRIDVPHFTSSNVYVDPTHRGIGFSVKTFRFFVKGTGEHGRRGAYYFDFEFAGVAETALTFTKGLPYAWNWLADPVVNVSYKMQCYYEATGLARLFPAENLRVVLIK